MNTISNSSNVMPNANLMMNKESLSNNLKAADTDNSGGVTIEEISASEQGKLLDNDRMIALFEKFDADKNGEITEQEMVDMMEKMKEKIASMGGLEALKSTNANGGETSFLELLKELDNTDDEEEEASLFKKISEMFAEVNTFA